MGFYANGLKTGKWIFKSGDTLSEVDYVNGKIVNVSKWSGKSKMAIN